VANPDGLAVVDPDAELEFLHQLPVELMWGVAPVTKAWLAEIGVLTIGQLAGTPGWALERLLGPAAGEKLAALACNRDPRESRPSAGPDRQARSRRSAASQRNSGFFGPPCRILRTASPPGSGPGPGLAEP
jgi:DNA polymerase-4